MTHTIEIKTSAVAREVYALAALQYVNAPQGVTRPALLTHGHEPLLHDAARTQFAMLVASLVHTLADADPDGRPDGTSGSARIMSLTLHDGEFPPGTLTAIRRSVEHILALRIMEAAHHGSTASGYATEARAAMPRLLALLGTLPSSRRPCWL